MTRRDSDMNAVLPCPARAAAARRLLVRSLVFVGCWLVGASVGLAVDPPTRIPAFTGETLIVADAANNFGDLAEYVRAIDDASPQTYYIVIVKSAGDGEWATLNYAEKLVDQWRQAAPVKGASFDGQRSIVMVLALQNRRIVVHPGSLLQTQYGFQGDRIDRDFVKPYFIPSAAVGDYTAGFKTLTAKIDEWFTARDAAARRNAQLAEQAREDVIRDLDQSLKSFPADATEVEKDALTKQALGAPPERFSAPIARARGLFDEATKLRTSNPDEALRAAQSARSALNQVRSDVGRWALNQADAQQRIAQAEPRLRALEEAVQAQDRTGAAVDPLRGLVDESSGLLDAAAEATKSDPTEGLRLVREVEKKLDSADALLKSLPRQREEVAAQQAAAKQQVGALEKSIALANERGVDTVGARRDLDGIRAQLTRGEESTRHDYNQAVPYFRRAIEQVKAAETRLASETESHLFWSRDLPIASVTLLALLVGGVLFWRWRRHTTKRRAAKETFAAFKARVMELSDSIDALRERHRLLPASDPDFTSPIQGETLKVYNGVQADLDRLRERWLELMDVWEKSQKLIPLDGPFSDVHLQQALDSLALVGDLQSEAEVVKQRIVEPLDKLNRAHEDAAANVQKFTADLGESTALVPLLAQTGRTTTAYAQGFAELDESFQHAQTLLTPDPLGVSKKIGELQGALAEQTQRLKDATQLATNANELIGEIDAVAATVAEQRQSGETLQEEGANPDHWLAEARAGHAALVADLDRADVTSAQTHLEAGRAALDRAQAALKSHAEAKAFCERELPATAQRREQLNGLLATAREQRATLEKEFLPALWREADDLLNKALANLGQATTRAAEASQAAERTQQRYLHARRTLEALQAIFHDTQSQLTGVGVLLARLRQLRTSCQERSATLRTARAGVERYFSQYDAIVRSDARAALAQAVRADDEARRESQEARPDWTKIAPAWAAVETLLSQAQDLADNDVAQHAEAQKLASTLHSYASRVQRLLESSNADRQRANQRFQSAQQLIAQSAARLSDRQGDWKRLLDELNAAQEGLARAEQMAQEDVRLAQQVEGEISEAETASRRAQSFYRLGVKADYSQSQRLLDDARRARANQEYERAIELANQSEQASRAAENAAHREADERERRQERERQLRQAAAAAAVLANAGSMRDAMAGTFSHRAHGGSFGSSSSSGSSRPSQPEPRPNSGASQTSIPSGASQSGW